METDNKQAGGRLIGIDVARALALVGMLAVHFGPQNRDTVLGTLYAFPHGRASVLFAVVAGIGIALLSRRPEKRGEARTRLVWFAVALLPLGLFLQTLDHNVAVILHSYAGFFLFGALLLGLPRRTLLTLAIGATLLGPALFLAGRGIWPPAFGRSGVDLFDSPLAIARALLHAGPYPLLVWAAPVLWGMWLGRLTLSRPMVQWSAFVGGTIAAMAAAGLSLALAGALGDPQGTGDWRHLYSTAPHSQMPLWLADSVGVSFLVVGAALIAARRTGALLLPLALLGQMALTVYVAHVVGLHFARDVLAHADLRPALVSLALFTLGATGFAVLWHRRFARGPLEALLHWPWDAVMGPAQEERPETERA